MSFLGWNRSLSMSTTARICALLANHSAAIREATLDALIEQADCVVVITDHSAFDYAAIVAPLAEACAEHGLPAATSIRTVIVAWSFFPVALLAIWTKDRRVACACLIWLIALYPLSAVWH